MGDNNDRDDERDVWNADLLKKMEEEHRKFMAEAQQQQQRSANSNSSQSQSQQSDNPFIGFKDFVDSHFNKLTEAFKSLPANIAELRHKMEQERERAREEERDKAEEEKETAFMRRWAGPDFNKDFPVFFAGPDLLHASRDVIRRARALNVQVPFEKVQALFRESDPPLEEIDPAGTVCLHPGLRDQGHFGKGASPWPPRAQRWLSVDWFKRSPYSPFCLEEHADMSQGGLQWRLAFEDLLNASLDKPLPPVEDNWKRLNAVNTPALHWMHQLQDRGILPPQLPGLYNNSKFTPNQKQSILDLIVHRQLLPDGMDDIIFDLTALEVNLLPVYAKQINAESAAMQAEWTEEDLYNQHHAQKSAPLVRKEIIRGFDTSQDGSRTSVYRDSDDDPMGTMKSTVEDLYMIATKYGGQKAEELLETFEATVAGWRQQYEASGLEDRRDDMEFEQLEALMARTRALYQDSGVFDLPAQRGLEESPVKLQVQTEKPGSDRHKVDVLSSLTTTQTTRHPDGTVTKKIVLKERFADGREETTEKVHTYQDTERQKPVEEENKDSNSKGKGWFWL